MKRLMLCVALASLLLAGVTFCQEQDDLQGDPEYQMDLQRMEIELENLRAEAEFGQRMREIELEGEQMRLEQAMQQPEDDGMAVLLILCAVVHVLVAVWIYQDIRHRNAGSGLWIVLGLLAGLLAALVYAVVRLGDKENGGKK
jgi:hypothetical protein